MRSFIELQYDAIILQWAEPLDDGGMTFAVLCGGALIVADSFALLLSALQDLTRQPLRLAA